MKGYLLYDFQSIVHRARFYRAFFKITQFKGCEMKKIFIGISMLAILAISLYAGVLMSQEVRGTKTVCVYSDGSITTIDGMGICPATN